MTAEADTNVSIKRITIIVPADCLEPMERCLCAAGVPEMTIDNVRVFGEHANYFSGDFLLRNVRIEVHIGAKRCDEVCAEIRRFAADLHPSAGILAAERVDRLVDLNSGQNVLAGCL